MNVFLLAGNVRVQRDLPVEIAATVDGETVQVALEWALIERWLGELATDPSAVRNTIQQRRQSIERVIQSRVYAHGIPISGEMSLGVRDLGGRF
jgi:hypothetical protein